MSTTTTTTTTSMSTSRKTALGAGLLYLATFIFSGILERHPGLQIVMAESGVSWLPFFLARADLEWSACSG